MSTSSTGQDAIMAISPQSLLSALKDFVRDGLREAERFVLASEWRLLHSRLHARQTYESLSHSPLKDPIRLLLLYPPGSDGTIHCKFVVASLTDLPPYVALSYTWGNPFADPSIAADEVDPKCKSAVRHQLWESEASTHVIYLNGRPVTVGQNLFDALCSVRHGERKTLLWVDALCINQADDIERRQQVSIMDSIYRKATLVHVWLGPAVTSTGLMRIDSTSGFDAWLRPPPSASRSELFRHVLTSSWFQRLWIIQEIVVASNIVLSCEGAEIQTWEIEEFIWKEVFDVRDAGFAAAVDIEIMNRARVFFRRIVAFRELLDRVRLEVLVYAWRYGQCENPRDKVYALLSLARQPEGRLVLPPYYSISVSELRRNLVLASIEAYGTLDVLRYVDHVYDPLASPSWIFTLELNNADIVAGENEMHRSNRTRVITAVEPAHRHPDRSLPQPLMYEGRVYLELSGRVVLGLSAVGDTVYGPQPGPMPHCKRDDDYKVEVRTSLSKEDAAKFSSFVGSCTSELEILATDEHPHDGSGDVKDEKMQDLPSDESSIWHAAFTSPLSSHSALIRAYAQHTLCWDWSLPRFEDFSDMNAAIWERSICNRYPSEMYRNRRVALGHRRCHVIVPKRARPGDVVVALSHSRTPFVFRRIQGRGAGRRSEETEKWSMGGENRHKDNKDGLTDNADGNEGNGISSFQDMKLLGNEFIFIGACYTQHRIDWEAFESFELGELDTFRLF